MFVISVLPLTRGTPHRELSYFSPGDIPLGSIVRVKLRGKASFGLVMRVASLEEERQNLRKGSFTLNKLSPKDAGMPFSRSFLRAAFETAAYHAVSAGALLERLAPAAVLKRAGKLPTPEERNPGQHHEVLALSASLADRIGEYRALARESLARGSSLLIIVPTILEAERLSRDVGRGIEERVRVLHGGLSEKAFTLRWGEILSSPQSMLVIGTPLALSCPRSDLSAIILERETSRAFEEDARPFFSMKRMAEYLARALEIRLILAATAPSIETAWRQHLHEIGDYGLPHRRLPGIEPRVLDAKKRLKEKGFDPLLPEAYAVLDSSISSNTPLLILAARRGAAPLTVCDDCGTSLSCERCTSPLVLHRGDTSRFLCHVCGKEEKTSIRCRMCGGWRLTALGIGIDRIAEVLGKTRPSFSLMVASHDRVRGREVPQLVERFMQGEPQILISTEFIVPHLPDTSADVIVASLDSFMSVPEYRMNERIFSLLAELRTKAKNSYLIETRVPDHSAIRACVEGSASKFLREESEERARYGYPPTLTLLRISISGTRAKEDAETLAKTLSAKHALLLREGRRGGRFHILLRIKTWPDLPLLKLLRSLPQNVEVQVNPPALSLE